MTLLPHGRGGLVDDGRRLGRFAAIAAAAMMLAMVAGCSSKQSGAGAGTPGGPGGIGTNELGANGGTSLDRFKTGQLGANGQGPLSDIHFDYNDYSIRAQDGEILQNPTPTGWPRIRPRVSKSRAIAIIAARRSTISRSAPSAPRRPRIISKPWASRPTGCRPSATARNCRFAPRTPTNAGHKIVATTSWSSNSANGFAHAR